MPNAILLILSLFIFLKSHILVADMPTQTQILPTIIIEDETPKKQTKSTDVPSGIGSKNIDSTTNTLGIELKNMENIDELQNFRNLDPWLLTPLTNHYTQIYGDFSWDQKLRAKYHKKSTKSLMELESGYFRDRKKINFLDNHQTIYDTSDDFENSYFNNNDHVFGKIHGQSPAFAYLIEGDFKSEILHFGSSIPGEKKQFQGGLSSKLKLGSIRLAPYVQIKQLKYNAFDVISSSNKTNTYQLGMQAETQLFLQAYMKAGFSRENFYRFYNDGSWLSFFRNDFKLSGKQDLIFSWIELLPYLDLELTQDISPSLSETTGIWGGGFKISSTTEESIGMSLKLRKFSQIPTPTQKFGDGGVLVASSPLPPETGVRAAFGPWWKTDQDQIELYAFLENTQNSPMQIASTPSQIKTMPLGKTQTNGIELEIKTHVWRFDISNKTTLQKAINTSEITWQNGKQIPGRPDLTSNLDIQYKQKSFKLGLNTFIQSKSSLDLANLWEKPAQILLSPFISYGKQDWEIKLLIKNISLIKNNPLPFGWTGQTAPNLLEVESNNMEVRLLCEIIL
ncbi:MAG: TonB-dependent receptor [Bdellovibrio sp.]|nr:TonB-dependent receptor [Bdellovibrio sp.]